MLSHLKFFSSKYINTNTNNAENAEKLRIAANALHQRILAAQTNNEVITQETLQQLFEPMITIVAQTEPEHDGADYWTTLQTVIEFIGTFCQNTLCVSVILNNFNDTPPECDGSPPHLTWTNTVIGFVIAVILASGEAYCHNIINTVNQKSNAELQQISTKDSSLSTIQKMALFIEAIAHVGEVASQFVIAASFVRHIPKMATAAIYAGAGLLGAVGSAAETRTHLNSIRRYNSLFRRADVQPKTQNEELIPDGYRPCPTDDDAMEQRIPILR